MRLRLSMWGWVFSSVVERLPSWVPSSAPRKKKKDVKIEHVLEHGCSQQANVYEFKASRLQNESRTVTEKPCLAKQNKKS